MLFANCGPISCLNTLSTYLFCQAAFCYWLWPPGIIWLILPFIDSGITGRMQYLNLQPENRCTKVQTTAVPATRNEMPTGPPVLTKPFNVRYAMELIGDTRMMARSWYPQTRSSCAQPAIWPSRDGRPDNPRSYWENTPTPAKKRRSAPLATIRTRLEK